MVLPDDSFLKSTQSSVHYMKLVHFFFNLTMKLRNQFLPFNFILSYPQEKTDTCTSISNFTIRSSKLTEPYIQKQQRHTLVYKLVASQKSWYQSAKQFQTNFAPYVRQRQVSESNDRV